MPRSRHHSGWLLIHIFRSKRFLSLLIPPFFSLKQSFILILTYSFQSHLECSFFRDNYIWSAYLPALISCSSLALVLKVYKGICEQSHSFVLQFTSVQLLSCVRLFTIPWTEACQASVFAITKSLKFAQTHVHWVGDAIQPSHPLLSLLLPPSIFPRIRVFSNESFLCIRWPKYWSFSFSISPSNEYSGLISFRMIGLIANQTEGSPKKSQEPSLTLQFKSINSLELSFLYSLTLTSIQWLLEKT